MSATPLNSFQEIKTEWEDLLADCPVNTLFLTPQWQEAWWDSFSNGSEMAGFYLREPEGVMAIASLLRQGDTVSLLGNSETFDYNDFMIRPGYETTFFDTLLSCMEEEGCKTLELVSLLESSPTLEYLPNMARQRGFSVEITEEDVIPGVVLPGTWDDYLASLSRKDRHELRRKLRRLESAEDWRWYSVSDPQEVSDRLADFLTLMRQSDPEKAAFLTPERERFFYRMAQRTADMGLIKLFFLEMEQKIVATALCFDYSSSRLLYNSGFNPEYGYYSVGLLLNALCLREAIEQGMEYFDFLRGPEPYKYHLGGQNRTLYRMVVKRS
jgi:CelD/BcsL family acetyltransferase involved in cellulose biosynthesis